MAKKIKAVACPQSGSAKVSKLRDDYFRCSSSGGADFFIDSDFYNHGGNEISETDRYVF